MPQCLRDASRVLPRAGLDELAEKLLDAGDHGDG
jgi:hypothetical protein